MVSENTLTMNRKITLDFTFDKNKIDIKDPIPNIGKYGPIKKPLFRHNLFSTIEQLIISIIHPINE